MSNQVIKGNVGELYVLKTGEIRDQIGLNDFHPTSNTNVLIVNIEDGGGENTQAQINFAPQSRPNWSSVWFPLFFVGHFSKRISNESAVRTFAQYKIIVPSIVLAMNLNSAYAMPVKITFRQIGGLEFLGQFDSATILQLEHPATQELSEELAVAYVYDGARSGFYQVEYNDELEIYEWVKTDNPTAHIQTKGYNMGEIKIQGGFGNNAPIQTISNAQYTLIWQELANHSQRINNIENQLESLMLDFEQQIEDVAQDLEDHIKDKSNPHETNADNAEYESGVSIKQKIDSDKQELDDHVSDKENPHGVTAEQVDTYNKTTIDNKDANTLQAAKDYTYSKVEIDNKDTAIMNKANSLESANMFKDVSYNNVNGVLTFTRYDDTTKQIDLPLELLVESGYYDEITNELVLVLANGSDIRIPVGNLLTDLDAHNIRFNGSGTNYLVNKNDVESAVKELDTRVKTNADNVALKLNTSDIVDNLNSNDTDKPLSANQGKVLNDTTAKLAVSNVFTQPQQVPNGTLPQHTVNKLQVETMFEMFKQQLRGYNLAMPDLTNATDLGGGWYQIYLSATRDYQYNVINGYWKLNGNSQVINQTFLDITFDEPIDITISVNLISQNSELTQIRFFDASNNTYHWVNFGGSATIYNTQRVYARHATVVENYFDDVILEIKFEKGTTATPYTVPGQIPQYKIVGEE